MRKILILGPTGSGKTTLSRQLAEILGVPVTALDDLFWDNDGNNWMKKRDEKERSALLIQKLSSPAWVLEGVYDKWLLEAFDQADAIILLQLGRVVRWWRVIKRYVKQRMGYKTSKNDSLRSLVHLLQWDIEYEHNNMVRIREKLKRVDLIAKTHYISKQADLTAFLEQLKRA